MDEFQEADVLWPDTEDELVVPFAPMDMEEPYEAAGGSVSSVAPVFGDSGRRLEVFLLSGAGPSLSSGGSPDADDDEEWQEADVLWPDTADEPRGGAGLLWPFLSCSGCRPGRRDGWTTGPAASSPINIPPANVAPRRRFRTVMNRRS